jgi:hypothetical protein
MPGRICAGCAVPLTKDVVSREDIIPRWLAGEVYQPELSLKQYRHNEDTREDEVLRRHDLGNFVIKNVREACNNGWMSDFESSAKPILLGLMTMKTSMLQLSSNERSVISAWAIKTAFMIASAQPSLPDLPWDLFRGLARQPEQIPRECLVLAAQLPFLPKSFLYACPTDHLGSPETPIHLRVGFSINNLHLVVVIPFREAKRVVRTSGIQLPLWPFDLEIRVIYRNFPTLTSPSALINFLTGLVEVGIAYDLPQGT